MTLKSRLSKLETLVRSKEMQLVSIDTLTDDELQQIADGTMKMPDNIKEFRQFDFLLLSVEELNNLIAFYDGIEE